MSLSRLASGIFITVIAFQWMAATGIHAVAGSSGVAAISASGVHTFADSSALSEGRWVKVSLNGSEDGIYQIPYSQLRQMGFPDPTCVGVYGFGGHALDEAFSKGHIDDVPEVATFHDAARQRILFYGRGLVTWRWRNSVLRYVQRQHPYATQATYFLHATDRPRRIDSIATPVPPGSIASDLYDERLLHESENVNIGKTGRELYGESFVYTQSQTFPFDITGMVGDNILVTANVVGNAPTPSVFTVKAGEEVVGSASIYAITDDYTKGREATISKAIATEGNELAVTVEYTPGSAATVLARLNYIRVQGQREIALYDGLCTRFRRRVTDATEAVFSIHDFDPATMQVWDVTSPTDVTMQVIADSIFAAPDASEREYVLVNVAATGFPGVTSQGEISHQNLHALPQMDMVIIAPRGLTTQAERLAAYRRSHDSLHVAVVTPDQVYNEFSSGVPDATAYRLLLKMFYDRSTARPDEPQLRYFLLFGDGYYDNHVASRSNFHLLVYESEASLVETASCVSDDYFGFLDDNEGGRIDYNGRYTITADVLDIGIGRLPVSSTEAAEAVVDKIIAYSDNTHYGSWKNRLCFLGDDDKVTLSTRDAPNTHITHCDSMVHILQDAGHHEFVYQKIYLPAYVQTTTASGTDYPDAKKEFQEALRQGVLLVNYAGHGNSEGITNEGLMTTTTAATLSMKNLPVWITATCDFSRYDDDETSCGETLLLNPDGGAIALITTSRVVYASNNLTLNRHLIRHIFDRHDDGIRYRLGDVMLHAKRDMGTDFNKLNYCLLGDPSLTLAYPEREMEITAINGEAVSQRGDDAVWHLPALGRVTMRGRVLRVGSTETDTTFNGLVYPTIYDAEETFTADKGLYQDPVFSFANRTKKVFSGRDVVRGGEFEFSFVVPQDIAYASTRSLVNLYACSEEGDEGQGYYNGIAFNGVADSLTTDTVGPEIRVLMLNEPGFRSGDVVNATPYFFAEVYDESGFNATGNSIGHDISLTIRSLSNPLASVTQHLLNAYFTTYTGDPTTGNVRFSIPAMDDGDYEATFRIWDVYNNSSAVTFAFTVRDNKAPANVLVQAYPNPARSGENVTFRIMHNRPEAATTMRVQVYTQTGIKVWEGEADESSAETLHVADAQRPDLTDTSLTADESTGFVGASWLSWSQRNVSGGHLAPGLYVYRAYLTSGSSSEASKSKKLIIIGGNISE